MPTGRPTSSSSTPRRATICPECATPAGKLPRARGRRCLIRIAWWFVAVMTLAVAIGYSASTGTVTMRPALSQKPALPDSFSVTKGELLDLSRTEPQSLWLLTELHRSLSSADPYGIEPNPKLHLHVAPVTVAHDRWTSLGWPAPVYFQWDYSAQQPSHPPPTLRQSLAATQYSFIDFAFPTGTGHGAIWIGGLAVTIAVWLILTQILHMAVGRPDRRCNPRAHRSAQSILTTRKDRQIRWCVYLAASLTLAWLIAGSFTSTFRSLPLYTPVQPSSTTYTGIDGDAVRRAVHSGNRAEQERLQTFIANFIAQQQNFSDTIRLEWDNPMLHGTQSTWYSVEWPSTTWSAAVTPLPAPSVAASKLTIERRFIGWQGPIGSSRNKWFTVWLDWTAIIQIILPFWLISMLVRSTGTAIRRRRIRKRLSAGLCAACAYPTPTA